MPYPKLRESHDPESRGASVAGLDSDIVSLGTFCSDVEQHLTMGIKGPE